MSDLNNILSSFESKFSSIKNKDDLQNLKSEFFGKNGSISLQFKKMGSLNPEERKNFAKELNTIKDQLTSKIEKKFKDFENLEINQKLKNEKIAVPVVLFAGLLWSFGPLVVRHMDQPHLVPWQYIFGRGLTIFILLNLYLYFEEGFNFYKNYK